MSDSIPRSQQNNNGTQHRLGVPVIVAVISVLLTIGGVVVYAGGTLQQIKANSDRLTALETTRASSAHEEAALAQRIASVEARLTLTQEMTGRVREALLDRMTDESRKQEQVIDSLRQELRRANR